MEIIIREVQTKLNAFDIYSLFKDRKDVIFLDSSKNQDSLGKYSYIGLNPFRKIVYKDGLLKEKETNISGDPFDSLKQIIQTYEVKNETQLPFIGGCMGYFAYDFARNIEKLPDLAKSIVDIPDLYFVFYDNIIIFDHHEKKVYITQLKRGPFSNDQTNNIENMIQLGQPVRYNDFITEEVEFKSPFTKNSYMEAVERMRQYIKKGDIYIANMTHTFSANTSREAYDIYKVLRRINPSPFSAFLPLNGFDIICSSPERFFSVNQRMVETRPIKGTRPRGKTKKEDEIYRYELEQSEKDRSELLMVVDLERNDLSKVCQPHSVKVTELFSIESYATVHQLVSTIVGTLNREQTAVDCMRACFPGGSITGTPKIRAMEIIEELEPTRRNIYTGCIGYFGFDGSADFNIVIRTILKKDNRLLIGVGGGITWESDPKSEYFETLDKAKALFSAISTREI
jgi:para-aminobenzoate synthetase component 1